MTFLHISRRALVNAMTLILVTATTFVALSVFRAPAAHAVVVVFEAEYESASVHRAGLALQSLARIEILIREAEPNTGYEVIGESITLIGGTVPDGVGVVTLFLVTDEFGDYDGYYDVSAAGVSLLAPAGSLAVLEAALELVGPFSVQVAVATASTSTTVS